MKFRIFNAPIEREPEVFFKLQETVAGGITLVAVDEKGDKHPMGSILTIMPDGVIVRHEFVSTEIGLRVDDRGRAIMKIES